MGTPPGHANVPVADDSEAPPIIGGLQLQRRSDFQQREWRWQRVGWGVWLLVLAAALAGLIGSGPLSQSLQVAADKSLAVDYQRYVRRHAPAILKLTVRPASAGDIRLRVSNRFLSGIEIQRIVPEPQQTISDDAGQTLLFPRAKDAEAATIRVHYLPENMGKLNGNLQVEGRAAVRFRQFVYP